MRHTEPLTRPGGRITPAPDIFLLDLALDVRPPRGPGPPGDDGLEPRSTGRPPHEGAANLLAAFRVTADAQSKGKGVLVVLNDEINSARDVSKTDTLRLHTFQSPGAGAPGVVDEGRVVYHRSPFGRPPCEASSTSRQPVAFRAWTS